MTVALPSEHKVRFYTSPNLKDWELLSDFGPAGDVNGAWECPDLLRIPSATGSESIWALKIGINPGAPQGGSGEQHFLGSFDGSHFTPSKDPGAHGLTNYGKDDYCAISYNGLPKGQNPILIGWMNNWQYASKLPTSPWRGQMSVPRKISFLKDTNGFALIQEPVIAPLRQKSIPIEISSTKVSSDSIAQAVSPPYELEMQFGHPADTIFGVRLYSDAEHWTEIGFDTAKKVFYIDRTRSGLTISPDFPVRTEAPLVSGRPYNLTLIVDRSSVEAFAQNGTITMTNLIYPISSGNIIQMFPRNSKSFKAHSQLWTLKSIWP